MKYTISRQFSWSKEKFEITTGSTSLCTVKAAPSKEYRDQFNIKISKISKKSFGADQCTIDPDPHNARNYLIHMKSTDSNTKTLFGQLSYEICTHDNYLYTIVIGKKLYKVRSCDLKNRRLAMIDTLGSEGTATYAQPLQCPETLFQVIDSFSPANKTYHVTIHDKEQQFGYLAIVILIDLHECQRQS